MDIINEFENYLKDNYDSNGNQNTIKSYISDIKQFFNFFEEHFGESIVDFSKAHIIEYKKELEEKRGLKYTTINRKIASLSIYENFLIENKIRKDEMKVIKKRDFYKIERPIITADMIPRKAIKKIRLKAGEKSKREYAMFVLLNDGGLRVSELINLQLARDINFEMYSIYIVGKGNKIRNIFMKQSIYDAIMDYLPEREKLLNGRENKYLFVSNKTANTNKPMSRATVNYQLEKYCIEINEKKINPHLLRHDCGTELYEEGYSDLMIKKWLGHSSNATDVYTHPGGELYRKKSYSE